MPRSVSLKLSVGDCVWGGRLGVVADACVWEHTTTYNNYMNAIERNQTQKPHGAYRKSVRGGT